MGVVLLASACGESSSPGPSPKLVDAAVAEGGSRDAAGPAADACSWTYNCQGKCFCIGGKLDNKPCADAVECQTYCSTSCQ